LVKRILVLAAVALLGACQSTPKPPQNTASVAAPPVTTPSNASFDPLPRDALKTLIVGKVLHLGTSNSVATYFADGRYDLVSVDDHWTGRYAFKGDKVCVRFKTGPTRKGSTRCGQVAMIGTDYWLIATDDGERLKVNSITAASAPNPS
jgi:hypothetical protein